MFRKILIFFISLSLCWTTVACGGSTTTSQNNPLTTTGSQRTVSSGAVLADGKYPVQQVTYNDSDGKYSLMLLNTPPGTSPTLTTQRLQMARLTDEQVKQNEKTFLEVKNKEPVLYLSEDFKIEYVHAVTEARANPQTGTPQTVVVRQESSFWSPFAGALAGQAIGGLLFRPQYYVPPVYQGSPLRGFGGYGSSYDGAIDHYRTRNGSLPAEVRNRQTLRSSGSFGTSSSRTKTYTGVDSSKSSGAGFGSSRLKSSGSTYTPSRSSSFGSSSGARRNSFGSSSGARRSSFGSSGRRR